MAIIYSYPISGNLLSTDILVGTSTVMVNGKPKNQTKSFELGTLANYLATLIAPILPGAYVPYTGATGAVNLGTYSLTANSIVKTGGTNVQYLMADGSVTTGPPLTGFVPYTGATGPVNLGAYDLTLNGATMGRGGGQIYSNIVFGLSSLLNNTTGLNNTYIGFTSGYYNTTGSYNTAIGAQASQFTTTGGYNTVIGNGALYTNTTGSYNLAIGSGALFSNTIGGSNTVIGFSALGFNTVGLQNIAIGQNAGNSLATSGNNTSGNQNIFIGPDTKSSTNADSNQIVIGYNATGAGSNTVTLGSDLIIKTILKGQIGIGTTLFATSAKVQIDSTTQGFLPPRMTTSQINAILTPVEGLVVYNTDLHVLCFRDDTGWRKVSHSTM